MSASNVTICKAGGLTVTECLCSGTPMILTCRAYGQEKANVKLLTAEGAARHVTTSRELFDTLKLVDEKEDALSGIEKNAIMMRKREASLDIASKVLDMAKNKGDGRYAAKKCIFGLRWGNKPAHPR